MVDLVVHRHELRATLARLCRVLCKAPAAVPALAHPSEALPAPSAAAAE
jgi:acetyl-CoA carboxylase carboxyl transferase subunit beta